MIIDHLFLKITFFDSWENLLRVGLFGLLAYVGVILMLRLTGKRSLAKMNAFDLVVTVALGSVLSTILLSKDVALAEGFMAMATLLGLQFLVSWTIFRSKTINKLVNSDPKMLFYREEFLESALKTERVTQAEVLASIRQQGLKSLSEAEAVILETDGS